MTGVRKIQIGEVVALHPGEVRADAGVLGAPGTPLADADLHNVVPFARPHAAAPEIVLPSDAARPPAASAARDRTRLLAFAVLSLALHGGLLAAAWRDPVPLASIGMEVMSVEIVVGATAPAGMAQTPGEQEVQAAATPDPQPAEPQREPEQNATEQPQSVPVAEEEKAPEKIAQPEPAQAEPQPAVAMVETPAPEEATAKPHDSDQPAITLLPQPEEKPAEPKPDAKPVEAHPKPVQRSAPAREPRRIAGPTKDHAAKQAKASAPAAAANNVGAGRSDANSNYAGLVSAHLRRHQQYPPDARSSGQQGVATVSFGLDGAGRVTSSRLARGSGIASIDLEVQAMVRRASPFPPPPSGRPVSFTVPVRFRLD